MALLHQLILASCATASPSGQSCDDTMGSVGPLPDWVLLVVGVIVVIIVAAVIRKYAKRSRP